MNALSHFVFAAGLMFAAAGAAAANTAATTGDATITEPRIALVIGNANYTDEMKLANPANDAELIGATLKKLGFDVTILTDSGQKAMQRAIVDFGERLSKAGPDATGLFYYAGHGLQVEGVNYLVPTDAEIEKEADVEIDAVAADLVLKQMAFAGSRVNIVILDSCRNNPLARDFRSVAAASGFAEIHAKPKGTFISYSTAPGEVAIDGNDGHSPFALTLSEAMQEPGIDLPEVFQHVREKVLEMTDQKQTPWDSSSLVKSFYFIPPTNDAHADSLVASAEPIPAAAAKPEEVAAATVTPAAIPTSVFVEMDHSLYAKPGSRLRAEPSTDAAIVARLPVNTEVHAIARSKDGAWWEVATANGTAYVHAQAVSEVRVATAPSIPSSQRVAVAAQQPQQILTRSAAPSTGIVLVDQALGWLSQTSQTGKPAPDAVRASR